MRNLWGVLFRPEVCKNEERLRPMTEPFFSCEVSGGLLLLGCFRPEAKERLGNAPVEERDQRPHKEGGNDGADPDGGENLRHAHARQQAQRDAREDANAVHHDTAELEGDPILALRPHQGHRVIGGDAKVRREVKGGSQGQDHKPHQKQEDASPKAEPRHQPHALGLREFHDIAQEEEVDKGGDPDFVTVHDEREDQQQEIDNDIQRPEADRRDGVKPAHERLKRVDGESGMLEHPDAEPADHDAEDAHQDTFCKCVHKNLPRCGSGKTRSQPKSKRNCIVRCGLFA